MFKQSIETRNKPAAIKRKALDPIKNQNAVNIDTKQNCSKQFGNNHSQLSLVKSNSPINNTKRGIFPRRLQENLESQKKIVQPTPPPQIRKVRTSLSQSQIPRLMKCSTSPPVVKPTAKKIKIIKPIIEKSHSQESIKSSVGTKNNQIEQTHAEEFKEIVTQKPKISQSVGPDSELGEIPSKKSSELFGLDIAATILCDIINQLNLKKAEQNIMKKRLPGFYMALPNFQGSVLTAFRSPNKILQFAWFRTTD